MKKDNKNQQATIKSDDPFFNAKRQWNNYLNANIASIRLWQIMSCVALFCCVLAILGLVLVSTSSKFIPYVIEVDKLGRVAPTSGPVPMGSFKNDRVIKATLASFIEEARSITPDMTVQKAWILDLYNKLLSTDPAYTKMNDYLNGDPDKNPFKRAEDEMVSVEITSILEQSETTYQIEWVEHIRNHSGAEINSLNMKALVTIYFVDAKDFTDQMIFSNPAGIYIQNFSWSQI